LFHITHVDNLASIVSSGLLCDTRVASGAVTATTIGNTSIKNRRLWWTLNLPDRPVVGDFVPFYFCPRSVMLYQVHFGHAAWKGGQDHVVHLVSRLSRVVASRRRIVFTDSNAATKYAVPSEDLSTLDVTIDWKVMPLVQWSGSPTKERRQAELLVHDFVPWAAIERVVVMSNSIASAVTRIMRGAAHQPLVTVDPTWYY
jgi:hypothetical protein